MKKGNPMTLKRFRTGTASERVASYARGIEVGDWILLANTSGIDYATMTMPPTVEEQAEGAFRNVKLALAHFGATLADVVRARIFVPNPADMDRVHPVIGREFADILPVNTTICCPLPSPEVLFEIEVTAWRPKAGADQTGSSGSGQ